MKNSNAAEIAPAPSPAQSIVINNAQRLEGLEKASLKASGVGCSLSFLDFSEDCTEVIEGDYSETEVSYDQMRGIFLIIKTIISELKEIRLLVEEHAPREEEYGEIVSMIDDAIKMLDAASILGQVRLSNEKAERDSIGFYRVWVGGFLQILRCANNRLFYLYERIHDIWERAANIAKPDGGGGIAFDAGKSTRKKRTYETAMAERIKAIQPKFSVLCDKYFSPAGSQLLTDPKKLGTETQALRNEIWELQEQMPLESEEGMDCRLAVDQLDFLIRLINAKFEFKESDLITLSLIVDRAGHDFGRSLEWLAFDERRENAADTLH